MKFCLKVVALPIPLSVSWLAGAAKNWKCQYKTCWFFRLVEVQQLYLNAFFSYLHHFSSSWWHGWSLVVAFGSSGSCALFSMPIVENLSCLDWSVLIFVVWNACFRRVLSFCIFFRNGWTELTLLYLKNIYLLWIWSSRFLNERLMVNKIF